MNLWLPGPRRSMAADTAQWAHDQRKRSDYASVAAEVGADAALLEQKFDWAMSEATRRDPIADASGRTNASACARLSSVDG